MTESVNKEELIIRKVCKEMGIEWKNDKGESVVDGIPVSDWFLMHNIFNDEEIQLIGNRGPIYYKRITMDMLNKIKTNKMDWDGWRNISEDYFISDSFLDTYGESLDWNYYTDRIISKSIRRQQSMGDKFYDRWFSHIKWIDVIRILLPEYWPSAQILNKYRDVILRQYETLVSKNAPEDYRKSFLKEISDRLENRRS